MREGSGLVSDVRGIASDGLRFVRTRLELLSIEVQEEKAHAVRQIVIASAVLYLISFGTLMAILALGLALSPGPRETFFAAVSVVFLAAAGFGVFWLGSAGRRRSLFSETIEVLGRDEQSLRGAGD